MKKLICLALILVLLSGCTPAGKSTTQTVFCMDTVMELKLWGEDSSEAAAAVIAMLYELEDTWSASDESSVLSALNRGEAVLTAEQQLLLDRVQALSQRTGGAFDPQLYSLVQLWGFPTDEFHVPTPDEILEARKTRAWDLGGAVKGYASAQAVELLSRCAVDRATLNLGGNVQTYGQKPDGAPWQIGIQNPEGSGTLGVLSVTGTAAVVTSGDYQRCFSENGITYHHILDPATGFPADSGLRSVTIVCGDGLTADVLSTALFVMGLEKASDFWRESDDFEAVFVLTDGTIFATEGAILSGCNYEVITRED